MKSFGIVIAAVLLMVSAVSAQSQNVRPIRFGPLMDGQEKSHDNLISQGWIYLFDSRIPAAEQTTKWSPLSLWRLRREEVGSCWEVVSEENQRILKNNIPEGKHSTDLISNQEFRDFDIHLEVRAIANSGLYLRGRYEIQIDKNSPQSTRLSAGQMGGIYSVSPPLTNAAKSPSEWQSIDASIRGYRITVYLNGELVQDNVEMPEGAKRIGTGTELGCWPTDGFTKDSEKPGPVMIQGNHGSVDLRNVRVRTVGVGSAATPRSER